MSCETEVRIRGATAAFVVSVTVQALIKVSQSIAERDESNQQSPTQSTIVEAKLRLADGYRLDRVNRTILRYRRYTSRAKTFLSFPREREIPSSIFPLLWFTPSLRLEFKISFPFLFSLVHARKNAQEVFPWISSGLSRSRRGIVFVE